MFLDPAPTAYDVKFRLFGIPIRVQPWFWVLGAILGFAGFQGGLAPILIFTAVLFVSILVHELGHALSSIYFGGRPTGIVLYGMGGLTAGASAPRWWQRIVVLAAGASAELVLAVIAAVLFVILGKSFVDPVSQQMPWMLHYALVSLLWINVIWGLVNLVPVYPLDGGQITAELVAHYRPYDPKALAHRISMVAAVVIAVGFLFLRAWFATIFFGYLAYTNYKLIEQKTQGSLPANDPWERGDDWWRRP